MHAQQVMFLRRAASKLKPLTGSRFFSSDSSHDLAKSISELNQEMESVFGAPPPSSLAGSLDGHTTAQESHHVTNDVKPKEFLSGLTHVGSKGEAQMVDVSSKEITKRVAVASCKVILGQKVFDLVSVNQMEKGDVLAVAKIAGVCGAKQQHTPCVIILIKMAEEWLETHNGNLPSTREEKKVFKDLIKAKMTASDEDNYKEAIEASFKVFSPQGISPTIQQILNDNSAEVNSNSSDFWVLVAALKEFIADEGGGEAPLEGAIPDMTSSTELYVSLQKVYQAKAEADFLVMEKHARKILKKIGRDPDSISKATIKSFCKNARKLKVCRYRSIEDEYNSPVQLELQKYLTDEDYCIAVGFYILLRAVDRFAANYNRFPGQFDGEMDEEISRLKTTVVALLNDLGCNGSTLTEDLINEMCRYGAAELHAVAAFIGGIASQEVIKLITRQFVPMCGTYIFNGIDHKSQLLLL